MKFTKENTLQLKGIAVIFLLYHHLFNSPSMYQNFEVSFFPLTERIVNLLSWFGKNCVSFFAFLSAYGLAVSYMKLSEKKGAADGWIKRRLLKLYKGYWFVFDGNYKKIIPSENAKLISPTPSKNNKKDSDTTDSTGDDTTAEELDAFVDEDVADEYEDYDDIAYVILYPRLTTVSVTINK